MDSHRFPVEALILTVAVIPILIGYYHIFMKTLMRRTDSPRERRSVRILVSSHLFSCVGLIICTHPISFPCLPDDHPQNVYHMALSVLLIVLGLHMHLACLAHRSVVLHIRLPSTLCPGLFAHSSIFFHTTFWLDFAAPFRAAARLFPACVPGLTAWTVPIGVLFAYITHMCLFEAFSLAVIVFVAIIGDFPIVENGQVIGAVVRNGWGFEEKLTEVVEPDGTSFKGSKSGH
ncbi:unnamed protein product [Caenorhabditis sp. 36 PRJEB53466]|nr:unnamed protein product [Caenorhabditis sp. 36 PRJEB53466]